MQDQSNLDKKYFIDDVTYNCPYCNRNNVPYRIKYTIIFDWTKKKKCLAYFVECSYCSNVSIHLSYSSIEENIWSDIYRNRINIFKEGIDIDSHLFYSQPTSFFVMDERIPMIIRDLITESEGCLKMNFLTGASACVRKAIYELLVKENTEGDHYSDRIKFLKNKYKDSDPRLFDSLAQSQFLASDKLHEQSWDKWDSNQLKLLIENLKDILYEIYVLPKEKDERYIKIKQLQEKVKKNKNEKNSQQNKSNKSGIT